MIIGLVSACLCGVYLYIKLSQEGFSLCCVPLKLSWRCGRHTTFVQLLYYTAATLHDFEKVEESKEETTPPNFGKSSGMDSTSQDPISDSRACCSSHPMYLACNNGGVWRPRTVDGRSVLPYQRKARSGELLGLRCRELRTYTHRL